MPEFESLSDRIGARVHGVNLSDKVPFTQPTNRRIA